MFVVAGVGLKVAVFVVAKGDRWNITHIHIHTHSVSYTQIQMDWNENREAGNSLVINKVTIKLKWWHTQIGVHELITNSHVIRIFLFSCIKCRKLFILYFPQINAYVCYVIVLDCIFFFVSKMIIQRMDNEEVNRCFE